MSASIFTEYVRLRAGDGTEMQAYVARPKADGKRPGIMVFQEAFGVNAHIRDVTERFASKGFVAISPELYHRTAPPGFEAGYTDFNSVMPHMQAVNEQGLGADIGATHEWLTGAATVEKDAVASVGYCMGGRVSFLANALVPIKAAVSYYGGGIAPGPRGPGLLAHASAMHGPMLLYWGGLDQHIPKEQTLAVADALRNAKKPYVHVEFSNADHGFFCDARPSYNAEAAAESWALTHAFLASHLGTHKAAGV
jgi:carboxymethylenebutenolidase